MTTTKIKTALLAMLFVCAATVVKAQPDDPGDDPDPAIPFDGGISLVVAAGIAYAAKKGYDKRRQTNRHDSAEK